MGIYQAIKELKVQLIRGQRNIDAGFVQGCGTRCTHIKPVESLADQSASIKTSSTKHTSDVEQFRLSPFNCESIEGILKYKSCVEILGASRWCLVQLRFGQVFQAIQNMKQRACEGSPRGRQPR